MPLSPSFQPRRIATAPSSTERRPLVMVIDPDVSARSVLEVALGRDGFDVWSADNSEQGLELMAVDRVPDVVVLESGLGGEDGFSLVSQLRGTPRTAGVKVLLLARPNEPGVAELAEVVGVDGFVQKPAFARDVAVLVRLELARRDGLPMTFQAASLPPVQLLRAVLSTPRSGEVILADGRGQVRFANGHVTDVRFEGGTDVEALVRALAFTRGSYSVRLCEVPAADDFVCGLRDVVQRLMPRLARWAKVLERSLPLDARLGVDFARLSTWLDALPDEVNRIVQLFDGHRSVEDVVADSPFDETLTLEVATRLYLMGVVVPVTKARDEVVLLKPAPRLFEPRPTELDELMHQLFDGKVEIRGEEDGAGLSADDWFRAPEGSGLEVVDPAGGWKAVAPAALTQELAPELKAQLDAFEIPIHVEAPESAPEPRAVSDFAHALEAGSEAGPTESIEQVMRTATGDAEATVTAMAPPAVPDAVQPVAPEPMPELPAASAGTAVEARTQLEDPQERIITPLLTPAVSAAGNEPQQRIVPPVLLEAVAPVAVPAQPQAAFFNEEAVADDEDFVPVTKPRRTAWPFLLLALAALGAAVLFDALKDGEPAVEAPVVTFAGLEAPPPPVELPDIDEPVFFDDAPVVDESVDVSENLAEARRLYEAGRYKQAKSLLEQVLTDAPKSVTAWILLGLVKYDSMDIAGAREAADKVLAIDPENARVQVLIATLHFEAGDYPAGRTALHRYLQLEPEGPFAADAKALLRR
ncbi:MAG: tetratricopeptide repeat protein [Myxococcota bacterium]